MNNPQVEEHLADLREERYKRQNAADALSQIGDVSAVPALLEALKDKDRFVRYHVAEALGIIGDVSAVPALIEVLKDENETVREKAAEALGSIGDASAVPALHDALKDDIEHVRGHVAHALGKIGDASVVPALMETLKDEHHFVRYPTVQALVKIGPPAVPYLIEALKKRDKSVRECAAGALEKIGDSVTLPRRILAYSRFSAQERINVLEKLRRVHYNGSDSRAKKVPLRYKFPTTRALCKTVLKEEDAEVRAGAQSVLDWLNGTQHLLRPSQPDTSRQSQEYLRATQGGEPETKPDTLLRAGQEPGREKEAIPPQSTIWERLFGRRI